MKRALTFLLVLSLFPILPQGASAGEIRIDRSARGAFSLLTHGGKRVSERDFGGRHLLVFFGYGSCPDVCPSDLATMAAALEALGDAGKRVQPLFVTLDPGRDTPPLLGAYVKHFHPRMVGLTGTAEEIAAAAEAYGVRYMRFVQANAGGRYTIDHSAAIYLVGPEGRFRAAFEHGTGPREMATAIARYLKEKNR